MEAIAMRMFGFHPDTPRLAREVTVGFMGKEEARKAISFAHDSKKTMREVLTAGGII